VVGVNPRSAVTKGPNHSWRSQHPKTRLDGTIDFMFLTKLNPVEPPWYVTRMPGGVGGEAPRGVPLSQCVPSMFDSLGVEVPYPT